MPIGRRGEMLQVHAVPAPGDPVWSLAGVERRGVVLRIDQGDTAAFALLNPESEAKRRVRLPTPARAFQRESETVLFPSDAFKHADSYRWVMI